MSKRFGRQQKRKLKQQIEQLEKEKRNAERETKQEKALSARARKVAEDTAQVLGRYFMTLDPADEVVRDLKQMKYGWRVAEYNSAIPRSISGSEALDSVTYVERVLPILYGTSHQDELRKHIHIQFYYGSEHAGYAISKESLALMPREVAVKQMVDQMASHLDRAIKRWSND